MEKLIGNKYFFSLYFFLCSSVLIIFLLEFLSVITKIILNNENLEFLTILFLSSGIFINFFLIEFFRIRIKFSSILIRKFYSLIFFLGIINNLLIPENYNLIAEILIIDLGAIYLIFKICKEFDHNPLKWLGLNNIKLKDSKYFLYYFLAWPLIIIWGIIVEYLNIDILRNSNYSEEIVNALNRNYLVIFFLACIIAPLSEEIIFRGFFYKIIKQKYNTWLAIVINSFFFGVIHLSPSAIIPASILGVSLSMIRIKTQSVYGSILIHSLHNLFAPILTLQAL